MEFLRNRFRGGGKFVDNVFYFLVDEICVEVLLWYFEGDVIILLIDVEGLVVVDVFWIKDECGCMGFGLFKVFGVVYVIVC